jgi:hypothetical protein
MHVRSTCAFSWHACMHARTHSSAHTGSPGALARALAHCTAHMHVRTRTRDIPHVRTPYSADPSCKDRWGGTPMDDCARGGTMRCVCACVCVCVCVCVFVCVCVLRAPEDAEHECSGLAQQARADKEPVQKRPTYIAKETYYVTKSLCSSPNSPANLRPNCIVY